MGDVYDSRDDPGRFDYRFVDVQDSSWPDRGGLGYWCEPGDGRCDFWPAVCPFVVGALAAVEAAASVADPTGVCGDCVDSAGVVADVPARLSVELHEDWCNGRAGRWDCCGPPGAQDASADAVYRGWRAG